MRILHVFKTYYPLTFGGVEQVISNLSKHTLKSGNEVSILICGKKNKEFHHNGVKVYCCKANFSISNNPFSISFIIMLIKMQKNYDILHLHYPFLMNEICFLLGIFKKPYVITYHSDVIRGKLIMFAFRVLANGLLKKAFETIYTSENYKNISYTSAIKCKKSVIPLTLDKRTGEGGRKVESTRINNFKNDFVLFIGATRRYKGLDTLLNAAKISSRTFVVAGDGEEYVRLLRRVRNERILNVNFLGSVSDAEKVLLLAKCKLLVLPSNKNSEAFGVVLLEAFKAKKCVITSDLKTGVTYVNKHGESGLVFEKNDHKDLNTNIERIFKDNELYNNLCLGARKRFDLMFSNKEVYKYLEIYNNCFQKD